MARAETMEKKAQETVEQVSQEMEPQGFTRTMMKLPEHVTPPVYLGVTIASIIGSLVLWFFKKKETAIFVGLWPPTFLALGLFHKLIGMEEK